jgi:site-specific recombinase XerD
VKPIPITVPLSAPLKEVVKNIAGVRKKGRLFIDLPADQTMNKYLKEIAKKLGINKSITHKAGRHTFATFYLAKTKDITSLKEILGHSSLSETMIYAHVLDESKQEGVKCFDGLI